MKHMLMLAALAVTTIMVGCKSIEVDRRGQMLATDKSGEVVKTIDGNPVILDQGWTVDYNQHWNWQTFDSLTAEAGQAKLAINNYNSGSDTNLVALVDASVTGMTKLATAVGEAYVKIAGGGAQADTALQTVQKVINYFRNGGGDITNATVTTTEDGKISVSDGTTCTICDANGNCTTGNCSK